MAATESKKQQPEPDGKHDDLTVDPVSVYDAVAIDLHLKFESLRKAGFTKAQAEVFIQELVADAFDTVEQP